MRHGHGSKGSYGGPRDNILKTFLLIIILLLIPFTITESPPPIIIYQPIKSTYLPFPSNLDILPKIRECESSGNDKAKNKESSAKGRYQFLDSTWKHYGMILWGKDWIKKDVLNGDDNQRLAEFIVINYGLHDWDASKECWGPYLD